MAVTIVTIYRVYYQNPDKFQFKFSAILCQRLLLARKFEMLLVNSHILKTIAMSKPSAEYNRRAAIEMLSNGNNSVLWIPESIIYDVVTKCMALEVVQRSMPARKSHSKEREDSQFSSIVKRTQALISNDPGLVAAKISIDCWYKRANNCRRESLIKSYTLKIRQMLSEVARTNRVARLPTA